MNHNENSIFIGFGMDLEKVASLPSCPQKPVVFGEEYFAHPSELDTQPSVQLGDVSAINIAPIESSIEI